MAARLRVLTVGRAKRGPFAELDKDYSERLARLAGFDREHVPQSRKKRPEERRAAEGEALLASLGEGEALIALDTRGERYDSACFAEALAGWRRSARSVCFVIGGPDGHAEAVLKRSSARLSLGEMTLPHDLALVVLLEQLYRALLHDAGHPYARH